MPIGIPTACLYNLVPNQIKCCPTKRSAHHIYFGKTVFKLFFLGFSEVKNAFLSLHARLGEPSLLKVLSLRSISLFLIKL